MLAAQTFLLVLAATSPNVGGHGFTKEQEAQLSGYMEKYKPEILASSQVMYGVGMCRDVYDQTQVEKYALDLSLMSPPPPEIATIWREAMRGVYLKVYEQGRSQAPSTPIPEAACHGIVDQMVADAKAAVAARVGTTSK